MKTQKELRGEFEKIGFGNQARIVGAKRVELWSWIEKVLKAQKKELVGRIEKLHNNSEVRCGELECSQGGYEFGLEDVLSSLKGKK